MAEYYKISGDSLMRMADQVRRLSGQSGLLTPSDQIRLLSEIDSPIGAIVNIDMLNSGKNLTGNTKYNATIGSPGAILDGRFSVSNGGYMTVDVDFMSDSHAWTVAFAIDEYVVNSTLNHCAMVHGSKDVPSIYTWIGYEGFFFKLASARMTASLASWYDPDLVTIQNNSLSFRIPNDSKTIIAFRNDEQYISLWVNGKMLAKQPTSAYTSSYRTSTLSIGDGANAGRNMSNMKCSMVKGWARALSDNEMSSLISN